MDTTHPVTVHSRPTIGHAPPDDRCPEPVARKSALAVTGVLTVFVNQRTRQRTEKIRERLITDTVINVSGGALITPPGEGGSGEETQSSQRETYRVLAEYSAQGLAQSQMSFWASIAFSSLGFLVIIAGVVVAIFKKDSVSQALIPIIAGAIVEAVGGLFFTVNARTQKVMVDFFDKLREDRKLEEALTLVRGVPDPTLAGRLQVLLALQFVGTDNLAELFRQTVGSPPEW